MSETIRKLGKYEILEEIGKGGFATVYRARDPDLDRQVALKILDPLLMRDPAWVARFRREARAVAKLDHPHIVTVYEIGEAEGLLHIAAKLMEGGSLASRIARDGPLPWAEVVRVLGEVSEALDYAHGRGVIHRDLKSANVLLDPQTGAVLSDFGFASLMSESSVSVSLSGGIVGTPAYIAPEVWEGKPGTVQTDVYALACIVYEMVMGEHLFKGDTTPSVMRAHFQPVSLPEAWPAGVPAGLGEVLATALAKEPEARYGRAGELAAAVAGLVEDHLAGPYTALQAAIAAEGWSQAVALAGQIRAQKPGYRDLATLEQAAVAGMERAARAREATAWRDEAERALAEGDRRGAEIAAKRWQGLAPEDGAAAAFLAGLEPANPPPAQVREPASPPATALTSPPIAPPAQEPPVGTSTWLASPTTGPASQASASAPALKPKSKQPLAEEGRPARPRGGWVAASGGLVLLLVFIIIMASMAGEGGQRVEPTATVRAASLAGQATRVASPTAEPTDRPPTDTPPTSAPPTAVPPTKAPPTAIPPTPIPPTPTPLPHTGAWVDMLIFTEQNSAQAAVKQLQAGDIDIYAYSVGDTEVFETVRKDTDLSYTNAFGSYTELTFNPAGPEFNDGRLNPFSNPRIREAMNWLIDRDYMVQEIYGGLGKVKYTSLNSAFPDYAKYVDVLRAIETYYAYNPDRAKEVITNEMRYMGASLGTNGIWQYKGKPVVIIAIIRTEDERLQIGDYVCNQLETIGFTTDRQYKTRSEASPIWNQADPKEGKMHFYTGGWITTAVSRDDATNFGYFYTNLGSASPLWQAYVNTKEYYDVASKLWINDFNTLEERRELFEKALWGAQQDSVRVWLVDQLSFSPQNAKLEVAYDLAGGVAGSSLLPYTIRWEGREGGTVRIAQPGVLVEPWNPVAGSNWIYDLTPIRATGDRGVLADPYTGLYWPQRIESCDIAVKAGLPVLKTLDWLRLTFEPMIKVPDEAWVDWDAANQKFVTAAEKFAQPPEANCKVTVTYPKDMFETVKWHDGSPISVADFVMFMIMQFDPGKVESAIYDEAQTPAVEAFLSHFKGVVIESTDPLVITTYDDAFYLDAEWMVSANTWFPSYAYGEAPWHTVALGVIADAKGELAFSTDKAGAKNVEWMSFIAGPSLEILKGELADAQAKGTVPYGPTMLKYATTSQAKERYENLQQWYKVQGHFWVGSGPFYLDKAFPIEKTLTLRRFEDYPDPASKWARFGAPAIPVLEIDGPSQVATGTEAVYDVYVTFGEQPYPAADVAEVKYLVFDANGLLVASGPAVAAEEGHYTVTLSAGVTGKLAAGSNKLEVVVTSNAVSIPGIVDYEFVTQ